MLGSEKYTPKRKYHGNGFGSKFNMHTPSPNGLKPETYKEYHKRVRMNENDFPNTNNIKQNNDACLPNQLSQMSVEDAGTQIQDSLYPMALVLCSTFARKLTTMQKSLLVKHDLAQVQLVKEKTVQLGRDAYFAALDKGDAMGPSGYLYMLSRNHCSVQMTNGVVYFTNHSRNGCYINDIMMESGEKREIKPGDSVTLLQEVGLKYWLKSMPEWVENKENGPGNAPSIGVLVSEPIVQGANPLAMLKPIFGPQQIKSICEGINGSGNTKDENDEYPFESPIGIEKCIASMKSIHTVIASGCQVIHFSGHGVESTLHCDNGNAGIELVSKDMVHAVFSTATHVKLLVIVAHEGSNIASIFATCGIPHVVAVDLDANIEARGALAFIRIFYEALAKGESIQQCFDTAATNEDVLFHDVTPHKYRLLPKDSDHNDTVFSSASSTSTASSTGPTEVLSKSTCNSLPKLPKYYIEQKQVVNDICLSLLSTPHGVEPTSLFVINGHPGAGKSCLAIAVAQWVIERKSNGESVFYLDMDKIVLQFSSWSRLSDPQHRIDVMSYFRSQLNAILGYFQKKSCQELLLIVDNARSELMLDSIFQGILEDSIVQYPSLSILLTLDTNMHSSRVKYKCITLEGLGQSDSYKLICAAAKRVLRKKEVQKAVVGNSSLPLEQCVAQHPALRHVGGNPRSLVEIGTSLRTTSLDALVS